jgi:hypothetical protein
MTNHDVKSPIVEEVPHPTEPHILNYLDMLGCAIKRYRKSLINKRFRSADIFTKEKLHLYFAKPITRQTLSNIEKGDHKVSIGVYAAVLQEMGVWPNIIDVLISEKSDDYRYVAIVIAEIDKQNKSKREEHLKTMKITYFKGISNGQK